VTHIYFIQKGTLSFSLPRFGDESYYKMNTGDILGLEDFIYNLICEGQSFRDDKPLDLQLFETDDYGRRRFSARTDKNISLMKMSIFDFQKALIEFPDFSKKVIIN
jgi:hypothetical protein